MEYVQFKPVSAMSRMVCLIAHTMLSMNVLNCAGCRLRRAEIASAEIRTNMAYELTREAVQVYRTQELEEPAPVFWIV